MCLFLLCWCWCCYCYCEALIVVKVSVDRNFANVCTSWFLFIFVCIRFFKNMLVHVAWAEFIAVECLQLIINWWPTFIWISFTICYCFSKLAFVFKWMNDHHYRSFLKCIFVFSILKLLHDLKLFTLMGNVHIFSVLFFKKFTNLNSLACQ